MLSFFEDLLFVWEPADLGMSWHAPYPPKWAEGEKNFSKKFVAAGLKILISKKGCIMGQVNFY